MRSPPISIRPAVRRGLVPYVASAQTREQNGSWCFRASGGTGFPHRWHRARALPECVFVAILVFSIHAKNRGPPVEWGPSRLVAGGGFEPPTFGL
jgi:hypothetical protein